MTGGEKQAVKRKIEVGGGGAGVEVEAKDDVEMSGDEGRGYVQVGGSSGSGGVPMDVGEGKRKKVGEDEEADVKRTVNILKKLGRGDEVMVVTNEEEVEVSGEEAEETLGHRERRAYPSRNWLSRIPWLTQTGVNGKKRPPVG